MPHSGSSPGPAVNLLEPRSVPQVILPGLGQPKWRPPVEIHCIPAAVPSSIPSPAPKVATLAGQLERRHRASPPQPLPAPETGRPVQEGLGGWGRVALVRRGGVGPGACHSLLRAAVQTGGSRGHRSCPQPFGAGDTEGCLHGSREWAPEDGCRIP